MVTRKKRLDDPVQFPKSDDEWHSFLRGQWFDVALSAREYVDDLPETRATFYPADIPGVHEWGTTDERLIRLTGAWPVPDTIHDTKNQKEKWVNPNYKYAENYAEAMSECVCGAPVLRLKYDTSRNQPEWQQEHGDECCKVDRMKARVRLLENKQEIIKRAYKLGQSYHSVQEQLGCRTESNRSAEEADQLGIDREKLSLEGRKKLVRTCMVLAREHSTTDIATVFGLYRSSVSDMLTKESVTTATKLYSVRRQS